jgi:hypothetical protein
MASNRSAARSSTAGRPEPVVTTDEAGLFVPGVVVVVDPDRAEHLGAFVEDALSLEDALEAMDEE